MKIRFNQLEEGDQFFWRNKLHKVTKKDGKQFKIAVKLEYGWRYETVNQVNSKEIIEFIKNKKQWIKQKS